MGVHEKKRLTIRRMIKIFLLLSLAILSTTAREDFTHFQDAQSVEVHAPRVIDSSEGLIGGESEELAPKRRLRKHVRVARRLRDNKKVQQPITGSFNHLGFPEFPSTHQFQLQPARSLERHPVLISTGNNLQHPNAYVQNGTPERHPVFVSNGNLVEQTKAFVDSAQAQITFAEVFDASDCLGNVTDVIALMDKIVKLVEKNAPEIIYLEALIESLKNERDIDVLILASSKM